MSKLCFISMKWDIAELNDNYDVDVGCRKKREISLRTFLNVIHSQAVFNYHN